VFFSEVVVCNGNAEWQTRSPWIPIGRWMFIHSEAPSSTVRIPSNLQIVKEC
jgi:hypothetical protein